MRTRCPVGERPVDGRGASPAMRRPPSASSRPSISPSPRPSPAHSLPTPELGVETWRLRDILAPLDERIATLTADMAFGTSSRSAPATRPPTAGARLPNSPRPLTPPPVPPLQGSFAESPSIGVGSSSAFAGYMRAVRAKRDAARQLAAPVLSRLSSVALRKSCVAWRQPLAPWACISLLH